MAPPSSQDEALGRYSVSREVPRSLVKVRGVSDSRERVLKRPPRATTIAMVGPRVVKAFTLDTYFCLRCECSQMVAEAAESWPGTLLSSCSLGASLSGLFGWPTLAFLTAWPPGTSH